RVACSLVCCPVAVCVVCFFSSRRRHTRSKRDWSSDVCSSDLDVIAPLRDQRGDHVVRFGRRVFDTCHSPCLERSEDPWQMPEGKIGRASCREKCRCERARENEERKEGASEMRRVKSRDGEVHS